MSIESNSLFAHSSIQQPGTRESRVESLQPLASAAASWAGAGGASIQHRARAQAETLVPWKRVMISSWNLARERPWSRDRYADRWQERRLGSGDPHKVANDDTSAIVRSAPRPENPVADGSGRRTFIAEHGAKGRLSPAPWRTRLLLRLGASLAWPGDYPRNWVGGGVPPLEAGRCHAARHPDPADAGTGHPPHPISRVITR